MVVIKKQKVRAYVLLESLVALAVLVMIVSLVLSEVNKDRKRMATLLRRQEVVNVAQMAVQTRQENLTLNGISVTVQQSDTSITVYEGGKVVLDVAKR